MKKYHVPILSVSILSLVLFLHLNGMHSHWYVYYSFYDIIVHFLSGVGTALFVYYILKNPKYIIPLTFIAGIAWELFEVYYNITGWPISSLGYKLDTIKDLLVDTLGALVVWIMVRRKK